MASRSARWVQVDCGVRSVDWRQLDLYANDTKKGAPMAALRE